MFLNTLMEPSVSSSLFVSILLRIQQCSQRALINQEIIYSASYCFGCSHILPHIYTYSFYAATFCRSVESNRHF